MNNQELSYMFGCPIYISNINKKNFNKDNIIKNIELNYNKNNYRNNWDNKGTVISNIHHSYNDEKNNDFIKIDYSELSQIYDNNIKNYLSSLNLIENIQYNFSVENYTCTSKGQFMNPHIHPQTFSFIHYIKLDEKEHPSTLFYNPSYFVDYYPNDYLWEKFDTQDLKNSWLFKSFILKMKEDDIVIFPGCIKHAIPIFNSNKLRITIVGNIQCK
jgi:hypothetical protein